MPTHLKNANALLRWIRQTTHRASNQIIIFFLSSSFLVSFHLLLLLFLKKKKKSHPDFAFSCEISRPKHFAFRPNDLAPTLASFFSPAGLCRRSSSASSFSLSSASLLAFHVIHHTLCDHILFRRDCEWNSTSVDHVFRSSFISIWMHNDTFSTWSSIKLNHSILTITRTKMKSQQNPPQTGFATYYAACFFCGPKKAPIANRRIHPLSSSFDFIVSFHLLLVSFHLLHPLSNDNLQT